MLKTLFLLFCLYLLYKLIFEFIIPIYNTTTQVKQKVNEMQKKMNEQVQPKNNFDTPPKQSSTEKPKRDDYIDFEEVRKS
jgi:sortase (surface protein transpeptidase)